MVVALENLVHLEKAVPLLILLNFVRFDPLLCLLTLALLPNGGLKLFSPDTGPLAKLEVIEELFKASATFKNELFLGYIFSSSYFYLA